MEKMSWPPKGPMGPVFSEFLFVRFFQRAGEETTDNRYWPLPKFQELLMQLSFYVVPDQSLIQPGAFGAGQELETINNYMIVIEVYP